MSARTITLLVAILGTVSTLAACLTDPSSAVHLSAAQGLLVSALGGGAYALVRRLQKLKAGTPFKALLDTSEAKGAAIVYFSSILTAVVGIVPPQYAILASTIVTMLVGGARMLSGESSGGAGPWPTATVLILFGILSFGGVAKAQGVDGGVPVVAADSGVSVVEVPVVAADSGVSAVEVPVVAAVEVLTNVSIPA